MKRRNWTAGFLLFLVALGCVTAFAWIVHAHGTDTEAPPTASLAQPASRPAAAPAYDRQSAERVFFPATIEALEMSDLYAKASGFVATVKADIGDHVVKNQVLATIDNPEMRDDLAESQATLAAKKQLLASADNAVAQAQQTIEVARRKLKSFEATQRLAAITLKRQQELFAGHAATDQQLDEVRAKFDIASADSDVAQAVIVSATADLAAARGARAVAAAQVEVAAAQGRRIQTLLKYLDIVAPFDGVITRRLINRGDLVQAATTSRTSALFTCQRFDQVRIFCQAPEAVAARVNVGDKVAIKVFGLQWQTIDARVTRIADSINPMTRTMRIEVDLPNPGERLRPGMYAQVTLLNQVPATQRAAGQAE